MIDEMVRVLLVDDNPDDVSIIRRLLTQSQAMHFTVVAVSTLDRGMSYLEAGEADLLLLDYGMPMEDGLSFMRRAAALVDLPPVIIITGQTDHRVAAEAIRSGAADCVWKSAMTPHTLGVAAQRAIAHARRGAESAQYDSRVVSALARASLSSELIADGESTAIFAIALGRAAGLSEHNQRLLRDACLLHDIGMLSLPEGVLEKTAPLADDELVEVRLHPLIGERICASLAQARELCPIIRHHHERWDGSGYVDGLAGETIPLLSRIVSIADAYVAMTSRRPFRPAMTTTEASQQLLRGAGSQWDPRLVALFLDQLAKQTDAA